MSKILVAVHRDAPNPEVATRRIAALLHEIAPDVIAAAARVDVKADGRRFLGTLNASADCPRRGLDICQGKLYGAGEWWRPGSDLPDGSYTLIRGDEAQLEAIVDPGGMRSLYYYFDDRMLVVSNAQRAVTMYVGRFELDRGVAAWLISTGTIGPGRSYNRLLRQLAPGGVARLDRVNWTLDVRTPEVCFTPQARSEAEHLEAAEAALAEVLSSFTAADAETTALSLSGGCDSRLIANFLHRNDPEVAWRSFSAGPLASATTPGGDPAVAAEVARAFGFRHAFFATDASDEPVEARLRRFLLCSEGRIDHFKGYAGGMDLLKAQHDAGITNVIRGDQAFGGPAIGTDASMALRSMNLLLCRDIEGVADQLARFGLEEQHLPASFARRPDESAVTWRDRLYFQFYCPNVLGALNEIKTFFFDVPQPLLSARVQSVAFQLPDALRNGKSVTKALMRRSGPDLPIAKSNGTAKMPDLLRDPAVARVLDASLGTTTAEACFGPALADWIRREVGRSDNPLFKASRRLRRYAPGGSGHVAVGARRLAFRVHMAVTMVDQLSRDAAQSGDGRVLWNDAA